VEPVDSLAHRLLRRVDLRAAHRARYVDDSRQAQWVAAGCRGSSLTLRDLRRRLDGQHQVALHVAVGRGAYLVQLHLRPDVGGSKGLLFEGQLASAAGAGLDAGWFILQQAAVETAHQSCHTDHFLGIVAQYIIVGGAAQPRWSDCLCVHISGSLLE
jgi:hypothetical protein